MLIVLGDLESLKLAAEAGQAVVVINKCDSTRDLGNLIDCTQRRLKDLFPGKAPPIVAISCRDAESNGGGIQDLVDILQTTFGTMTSVVADDLDLLGVSERQSQLLSSCTEHLESFKEETLQGDECDIVIAAEHLRAAAGDVEEVLGVVFEKWVLLVPNSRNNADSHRFCVGK
jgi:tRNA modification GTPase